MIALADDVSRLDRTGVVVGIGAGGVSWWMELGEGERGIVGVHSSAAFTGWVLGWLEVELVGGVWSVGV